MIFRQIKVLCLVALVPAFFSAWLHPKKPSWNPNVLAEGEVTLSTVLSWKENVFWVDARASDIFEKDHIPGAQLLNEDDWDRLVPPVLQSWNPGQPVVVYCNSQQCQASHQVAKRLRELGLNPVYVLKGGWETWLTKQKS